MANNVGLNIKTPTGTYKCLTRDFDTIPTRWEIFSGEELILTFSWTDDNYGLEETNPIVPIPEKEVKRIQRILEMQIEALKNDKEIHEPESSRLELTQEVITMLRAPAEEDLISLHEVLVQILLNQASIMIELSSPLKDLKAKVDGLEDELKYHDHYKRWVTE